MKVIGGRQTPVFLSAGTLLGWGAHLLSFPGIGDAKPKLCDGKDGSENPLKIANLRDVVKIAAGYDNVIALRSDGTASGWEKSFFGDGKTPAQIPDLKNIREISAGDLQ